MLANIYGYGDENGKIIFNVPDELKKAGLLLKKREKVLFLEHIGIGEMFIKFNGLISNVVGKVTSPRLQICDTNPDQQLLFFYQAELSSCLFVKCNYVNLFAIEGHLRDLDLFQIHLTQAQTTVTPVKLLECYIQCVWE